MLQNIRDTLRGQRWLTYIGLGLLILVFSLWGASGLVDMTFGNPSFGLKVNGEEVPAATLQQAWQERQSQYQQRLKTEIPPLMRSRLQQQLLEQFTRETVVRQRAIASGFRVSDEAVQNAYKSETAFQVDGRFNETAAKGMLAQIGMSAAAYEQQLHSSLQISALEQGLQLSDFMTEAELKHAFALENEQREVRYALLPLAGFAAAVKMDEAKAHAWYDAHQDDYLSKESVRLQYAELRLDTIAAGIVVSPTDLEAWYQQNQSRYVEAEKRRARHILITVDGAKDAAADAAALAKAQQVLKEARSGADFSALAKKYSQDPGSARQGGDLGWALRGAYVQPFADKLFAMAVGSFSEPVKTQFGYHIIRLDEIQAGHSRTLVDAHAQIEADFRRERAADKFGDLQEKLQQRLESAAGSELSALAKEFGLNTGEVSEYTRGNGGALGTSAELSRLVFSDTVLKDQRVGGPVALGEERAVIVKVLDHHVPKAQPLAQVRAAVEAMIRKDEGTRAARAAAQSAAKQLTAGGSFEAVAKSLNAIATPTTWIGRGDPQPPVQIRDAAFAAPAPGTSPGTSPDKAPGAAGQPVYEAVAMDEGGAALLAVLAVKPGTAGSNATNNEQFTARYGQRQREADFSAYLAELQQRAKIRRNPSVFN